ncbi:hypothetical protein SVAN01_02180 [Stagonosporopsis vannaccii]|nr:hypothetical protein SVAN01_02180 [Stagonosporopsis vannaccii]
MRCRAVGVSTSPAILRRGEVQPRDVSRNFLDADRALPGEIPTFERSRRQFHSQRFDFFVINCCKIQACRVHAWLCELLQRDWVRRMKVFEVNSTHFTKPAQSVMTVQQRLGVCPVGLGRKARRHVVGKSASKVLAFRRKLRDAPPTSPQTSAKASTRTQLRHGAPLSVRSAVLDRRMSAIYPSRA